MLVVTVEFGTRTEHHDGFLEIAAPLAAATRRELGCRVFEFWCRPGEAGRFFLFEVWDDLAALEAHRRTPHVAAFREASASMVERMEVDRYVAVEDSGV